MIRFHGADNCKRRDVQVFSRKRHLWCDCYFVRVLRRFYQARCCTSFVKFELCQWIGRLVGHEQCSDEHPSVAPANSSSGYHLLLDHEVSVVELFLDHPFLQYVKPQLVQFIHWSFWKRCRNRRSYVLSGKGPCFGTLSFVH